ncbi:MAG: transcription termination factor NusA [Spirochaetaceae bacterium]|nr:transcription termination factor NusA [Spirochaetaceae bacterium]
MAIDLSEAVQKLKEERGMSEELIRRTIESILLAAYKRRFGNVEHAIIRFSDEARKVSVYTKKNIVDGVYDPLSEIDLAEARELNSEAELGDEILIEEDPKEFDRISVQTAKQTAKQSLRDIHKDSLYAEYKDKIGELVIAYYQRERNGTIYVELGKTEGILPKKFQSPRETYGVNDRIKALITEVNKTSTGGLQIVLSRTHTDFVRAIFEIEVPELYDKTVEIHKIVREPGYRTKMAVYAKRDDVDPVGACVGLKGVRIQSVIKELEGEKIDILKYDPDPKRFIKNALSPAEVRDVIILDEGKHQALAVVADSQFSLAIGKQGMNVKLANRLVDWNIDVKTDLQFAQMDIAVESRRAVSQLFGDEFSRLSELPGADKATVKALKNHGVDFIEDYIDLTPEKIAEFQDITREQLDQIQKIIEEYVEIVEEDEIPEDKPAKPPSPDAPEEDSGYICPDCGAKITLDMTNCPNCGIGLSFEYEEE